MLIVMVLGMVQLNLLKGFIAAIGEFLQFKKLDQASCISSLALSRAFFLHL